MGFIPVRKEYYMAPDSTRKFLQLMKSHIGNYGMKDYLFHDVDGLKYNGSMYNFGSEILLETNKLKMTDPPIANIKFNSEMKFYFDIGFSNVVDTYDQQNMIVCNIKRDALVASHTYRLIFNNVQSRYIIRSEFASSFDVVKENWYVTTTPPILVDEYNGDVVEYEMNVDDGDGDVVYYYQNNEHTQRLIQSVVNGTLTTIPLVDGMFDLPVMWVTCESLNYLPYIELDDNLDKNGNLLLTIGSDGHDRYFVYPYLYDGCTPSLTIPEIENYKWFLKVESIDSFHFTTGTDKERNYMVPIKSISYVYAEMGTLEPAATHTINVPEGMKIFLSTNSYSTEWKIHMRKPTDWDYDPVYGINPPYAWIQLAVYNSNAALNAVLLQAFEIKFNNQFLFNYESSMVGGVSGIHVDSTADTADNYVVEVNGVSHMMGDFDGLPSYLHEQLDRKFHRSHVDIYSIRDHNNRFTQLPMKRQTAGMIIDSAVPYNDLKFVTDEESDIVYDDLDGFRYYTKTEEIISKKNIISDIVLIDGNHFADRNVRGNYNQKRFVYHGNNNFSLGIDELDPDIEYGRAFVISNDIAKYENNASSPKQKSARTLARICDIPTSMLQLTNIPYYAPSILVDWNQSDLLYNRTECDFTDDANMRLINNTDRCLIRYSDQNIVFPYDYDLDRVISIYGDPFRIVENLNKSITLDNLNTTITPFGEATGYDVGDTVKFNIGGQYFILTVDEIDVNGKPESLSYEGTTLGTVNMSNLFIPIATFTPANVVSSGIGLKIMLNINTAYWNDNYPTPSDQYIDGLHLYQFDEFNNVWLYGYNNDNQNWIRLMQLSGYNVTTNPYDDHTSYNERRLIDVMLYNNLITRNDIHNQWIDTYLDQSDYVDLYTIKTDIPTSMVGLDDLSNLLFSKLYNYERSLFMLYDESGMHSDEENATLKNYRLYTADMLNEQLGKEHHTMLPRFNNVPLKSFSNLSKILYTSNSLQPEIVYYNPLQKLIYKYERISGDCVQISDVHTKTFYDVIPEELVEEYGYLSIPNNIYTSDSEIILINKRKEFINDCLTKSRSEILHDIEIVVGSDCEPFYYEGTDNPYTKEMLIDYLWDINGDGLPYSSWYYGFTCEQNVRMLRQQHERVLEVIKNGDNKTYLIPLGEQPTGEMITVSNEVHDTNYMFNDKEIDSSVIMFFKIPDEVNIVSFYDLRMLDDFGNDVSKYSIIIYRNKKYHFVDDRTTWEEFIK